MQSDVTVSRPTSPLAVRATVNLPGLKFDEEALVDPAAPFIRACLDANYIVPLPGWQTQQETPDA